MHLGLSAIIDNVLQQANENSLHQLKAILQQTQKHTQKPDSSQFVPRHKHKQELFLLQSCNKQINLIITTGWLEYKHY